MSTPLLHLRLTRPLAIIDCETTGLAPQRDRIVDLAVLCCSPDGEQRSCRRLLHPGIPIPPAATAVHGITDEHVTDCPSFARIAASLARLLQPCDLAGFNLKRFDLPLLLAEFRRAGIDFPLADRAIVDVLDPFPAPLCPMVARLRAKVVDRPFLSRDSTLRLRRCVVFFGSFSRRPAA